LGAGGQGRCQHAAGGGGGADRFCGALWVGGTAPHRPVLPKVRASARRRALQPGPRQRGGYSRHSAPGALPQDAQPSQRLLPAGRALGPQPQLAAGLGQRPGPGAGGDGGVSGAPCAAPGILPHCAAACASEAVTQRLSSLSPQPALVAGLRWKSARLPPDARSTCVGGARARRGAHVQSAPGRHARCRVQSVPGRRVPRQLPGAGALRCAGPRARLGPGWGLGRRPGAAVGGGKAGRAAAVGAGQRQGRGDGVREGGGRRVLLWACKGGRPSRAARRAPSTGRPQPGVVGVAHPP
jgi:translation initiation factor IF-2